MKTKLFLLLALAGLMTTVPAGAKSFDRGLGNPKKVYIQKGTVSVGAAAGYNRFNATGENATSGASIYGVVTNLNGNAGLLTASASASWFFKDNMSLGVRLGYNNTAIDINNAGLVVESLNFSNKHIVNQTFTGALAFRGYIPLFDSRILALFGEARLTGGFGYGKDYAETARGKEGTYSDIYTVALGLYPGVSVFVTDFLAVELSLPLLEGGYEWNIQTKGQAHDSALSRGFVNYKPSLLGVNLGIIFHF